jgi:hypothetical protein
MYKLKKPVFSCLLLAVLLIQTSCSSIRPLSQKGDDGTLSPDQVDLSLPDGEVAGEVSPTLTPSEETVRLGDRGGDTYTHSDSEAGPASSKRLRIGLSLGPGLYRTINFVSVLKSLERQNLAPQVITGTGFGAIVAAMYANGMTPEIIEWHFYRYFKEKNNYRLYSEEWVEDIDQYLLEKLKNKKIEDSSKKFYMTLFDVKTKKTYYFDKGNIRNLLLMNLRLTNSIKSKDKGTQYTAAFENEVFNANLMKRLGVDFSIGADVLGAKFDFEDSNEFLIGVYGRAAGRISRDKKSFDYFYSLPLSKMSLDSTQNGAFFLMETQKYAEAQGGALKKKIQQKISSISEL